MISIEWYRNFVAIYRAGSVSAAARNRALTQSAVSQQLAALESAVGVPLFDRTSRGMTPTARGEALYAQVFDALDRLDRVTGTILPAKTVQTTIRLGASPEYVHEYALPRLAPLRFPLALSLGSDRELLTQVESGALDAAVTTLKPGGRTLQHRPLMEKRYVLIGSADFPSLPDNADPGVWLNTLPWVSYSEERPITRRFCQQSLGVRFEAKTRLVVPDLRSVVRAVELGFGVSIVPEFVCRRLRAEGRIREIWPIGDQIPPDRWVMTFREIDSDREDLRRIGEALRQMTEAR